jgi:hypothetical protein
MSPLTFDQNRRQIRRQLFLKRQQDKDNSEARLSSDARKIDALLIATGYKLIYPTEWCRNRNLRPLQADISDLNLKDIFEAGNG